MEPRLKRSADRLRELIAEGHSVAELERESSVGPYIQDKVRLSAWLVKAESIIEATFGQSGPHFRHLAGLLLKGRPEHSYEVNALIGLLTGALDDLEGGFLLTQENLVASAVFDSVLEQARHLTSAGFKDPAAVLARVVLEDTLRRLARAAGIADTGKATALNDALRDAGCFNKPQWRLVQSWLDIGNAAAHGEFSAYKAEEVARLLDDVERFISERLGGGVP